MVENTNVSLEQLEFEKAELKRYYSELKLRREEILSKQKKAKSKSKSSSSKNAIKVAVDKDASKPASKIKKYVEIELPKKFNQPETTVPNDFSNDYDISRKPKMGKREEITPNFTAPIPFKGTPVFKEVPIIEETPVIKTNKFVKKEEEIILPSQNNEAPIFIPKFVEGNEPTPIEQNQNIVYNIIIPSENKEIEEVIAEEVVEEKKESKKLLTTTIILVSILFILSSCFVIL